MATAPSSRRKPFAAGADPGAVAVADLNGDGKLDIITANGNSNTVSVLLGNGDGTFQPPQTFAVGADPDARGGGRPDRRRHPRHRHRQRRNDTVSVLLGNGDGTFQPPQTFPVGESARLPWRWRT